MMKCIQKLKNPFLELSERTSSGMRQESSGGISLTRKLCFAAGGVPYQLTPVAISVSLQIFLLEVAQLEVFSTSMVLLVSRVWDAVTDPLVGYLVSRSRRTPIGKLTPRLVLSTPFGVLSYVLLWFVPQVKTSLKTTWFVAAACLLETLMSGYNVPYLSLSMFLGGDQRERDSATAYRMSVEMTAMLLASVIQGQVLAVYHAEKQEACEQLEQDGPPSLSPPHVASLQATQKAFLTSAVVIGGLFFICSLVLFLGVKEHQGPVSSSDKVRPSFTNSLKMLICHIALRRLVLGFVFSSFAFQTSLGNFALFCSHAANLGDQFQHLLLVLLISASVAVPLWQLVLLRIGKKATVFIGFSLFIPSINIVACVPSHLPVFMIMCVLMGFSVAMIFLLPWSMLPDVVEDFALTHPSCKDLEPLFFSCYAFCNKLAGGLAIGLSTMTLQFVGYKAGECHHSHGVVTALTVLFSPVPIALLLIGMMFFHSYPINERQSPSNKEAATSYLTAPSSSLQQRENAEQFAGVTTISHLLHTSNSSHARPDTHVRLSAIFIDSSCTSSKKRSKVSWV
ncbi:LOW QUALITY PROTEIN: sodium-dependent lysophosphatidylcholine symporter 1-like [Nerophis ophidion]|uniref:LOW QUALITY PROTEIN: sodium-dependent lysophosphatidylcholine symporter 1-like n=1 Tax=Nerophis ophidion TaxID=159077 RepID=UPI002ADF9F81|nr:LOW QUALITY PROTEIN: sodium-dependent lysophosphatidylcholine symporter 1-like [Nerophis ophidion]